MDDLFISDSEVWFFVPERSVWEDLYFPADEEFDCEAAENVLDDIILIEV